MHGLRKILRALAIIPLIGMSFWLFVDAAVNGPGEYQLAVATALVLVALGLIATWFWSPLG